MDFTDRKSDTVTKVRTETITFRMPSTIIRELRKEAESEKISLNTFVYKIFLNHVQWEKFERKVGFLPMTKTFLKEVINQMTDEQIIRLAEKIEKDNFKNILTFMKPNHDIDDFIDVLRTWLTVSWMQHNIENKNGSYRFTIHHDLGIKWSLYVKTLVSELSKDVLEKRSQVKITNDLISFII
jgi:hypothetical protein